ncbi:MAG: hypothetical protein ACRBK7_28755 [Acidimicrobiales bacterium]
MAATEENYGGSQTEAGLQEPDPVLFAGHDNQNGMTHLAIPELAGAQTIAAAAVGGSARARRQAKIMGWVLIAAFLVTILVSLVLSAI